MLYVLRTTFTLPTESAKLGESDRFLRWLYDTLPTRATMGCDVAVPRWLGNRYPEPDVVFQIETLYRNVFAAAADRLRIEEALTTQPYPELKFSAPTFELLRVYGDVELLTIGDPTKAYTHPC